MKKILTIVMALSLFVPTTLPNSALAGGNKVGVTVSTDIVSTYADGTSSIKITVFTHNFKCDADDSVQIWSGACEELTPSTYTKVGVSSIDSLRLSVSGSSNAVLPHTNSYFATPSDGYSYFYLNSTVAETKNIVLSLASGVTVFDETSILSRTVTFTTPPASTTTPTKKTTPTTISTQGQEEAQGKPDTPILNKLRIGENEIIGEKMREENKFRYEEGVKFSGTTIANGIVHLYFHSDPYETTVTADQNGNWVYTLDKDLGEGEHSLEVAVEDPDTKELSDKSEAYNFILVAAESTTESTTTPKEDNSYPMYFWFLIGGIATVLVSSTIGGIVYYKKKHLKKKESEPRLRNQ